MSSIPPTQTESSISNADSTVIHIHGDVTFKFHCLTINNSTLGATAIENVLQNQRNQSKGKTTPQAKQEPGECPTAPEIDVTWEENQDNGDGGEDNPIPPAGVLLSTTDDLPESLPAASPPAENQNGRGLYSECRQIGCNERLGNMFEREEHEVTNHFLCGDCKRHFACLEDIRQVCFYKR
jgi:hypothetical protein